VSPLTLKRVRRPEPALLAQLAQYEQDAFGPTGLRTYDLAVTAEAGAVFIAYEGEAMVGSCQLLRALDEPSFLYVVGFYVLPEHRRTGMGRKFLESLGEDCRRLGAEGLLLTVSPANEEANRLYRSAGFVQEAFVPGFYGKDEDRFILRKRFEGSGL
jgi:ribosomal protein S18 acetylase RimI-like enzyme